MTFKLVCFLHLSLLLLTFLVRGLEGRSPEDAVNLVEYNIASDSVEGAREI